VGDRVALLYPHFQTSPRKPHLFPPLGIAHLASQLKELGIPVAIHDCTFQTIDSAVVQIAASAPAVIGIYIAVTMSRNALRLLRALRSLLPETLFVAGGPLPTIYPESYGGKFDLVFRGECDLVYPRFCRDYLLLPDRRQWARILSPSAYPGMWVRRGSRGVSRPPIHHPVSVLNSLPLPDRSGFDHTRYQRHSVRWTGSRVTSIMITRGCPFRCEFCSKPIFGDRFRAPSLERTMEEIADIRQLGYDRLWIADDLLTLDLGHLQRFCSLLISRHPGLTWSCLSRVDRLNPEIVHWMREAGCVKVYLGLESGNNETLRLMNKRTTVEEGMKAVSLFSLAGIRIGAFFIVGYPGESVESIRQTFALALSLPLDEISFNLPLPLPGSALFQRVKGRKAEADWDVENENRFLYEAEFDERWLKEQIQETLSRFLTRKSPTTKMEVLEK
jgi:anaerobic magnesium-protoporphyrin IX monomethyl ester cyclase